MNHNAAETIEDQAQNQQKELWIEEQRERIKNSCPLSLQPELAAKLESFGRQSLTPHETTLEIRNLDLLIKNAETLGQAVFHYTERMAPLMPSLILKDNIKAFWESFNFENLETNQLKKIMDELVRKVEHSEKESATKTEVQEEIENKLDPEMETFLPFYFSSKERDIIYAERSKITDPKKLDLYRRKILKARTKREAFVDKKLSEIKTKRSNPAFGRKALKQLQKKCGDGINNLTQVEEVKNLLTKIEDQGREVGYRSGTFQDHYTHLIEANTQYKKLTGQDHPGFTQTVNSTSTVNNTPLTENVETDEKEIVQEQHEGVEQQRQVLSKLKTKLQETMAFWARIDPQLNQDSGFAIRGGNRVMDMMQRYPDKLPNYDQYVKMEEGGSQTLGAAKDGTKKFYRYRSFNIPGNPAEFTPERAASLNNSINEASLGDDRLFYLTSIWYIDSNKAGTKKSTNSMQDVLGHLNHLLSSIGTSQPSLAEAA